MCQDSKVCGTSAAAASSAQPIDDWMASISKKHPSSNKRYGSMVTPRMITVLQFCALCCLHVACTCCAASHAAGHQQAGASSSPLPMIHTMARSLASAGGNDEYYPVDAEEWSIMADEEPSNGTDTDDADAVWIRNAKYTLIPIIFVITLGASALPWYIQRLARAVEVLTIGACFTAGVILGAGLSHLMPDAMEAWEEYNTLIGEEEPYPSPSAIAGAVCLTLVWVDSLLVRRGMAKSDHGHGHGGAPGFTPADNGHSHMVPALPAEYYELERKLAAEKREKEVLKKQQQQQAQAQASGDQNYGSVAMSPPAAGVVGIGTIATTLITTGDNAPGLKDEITLHVPVPADANTSSPQPSPHAAVDIGTTSSSPTSPVAAAPAVNGHGHSHGGAHGHGDTSSLVSVDKPEATNVNEMRGSKKQMAQATIFFVALSIHSIFDGLSIGTEDSRAGFVSLLAAIGGHKVLDGFALGVPIFFANWSKWYATGALVFAALMTPLGIGISMAATELTEGERSILTRAVVLSMSVGSFLFIALVELLPAGLDNGKHINYKMIACCAGWGLMVLLAKYV